MVGGAGRKADRDRGKGRLRTGRVSDAGGELEYQMLFDG